MNDPKTRRRIGLTLLALLLLVGVAWALWPNGRLADAKRARAALSDPKLTPEQRREKAGEFRTAMGKLSPAQRETLMAEDRKRRTAEVAGYFKLSPKEKTKFLDERINKSKGPPAGQAKGQQGKGQLAKGPPPGGAGGKGNAPSTPSDRDGRRQQRLDGSTPAERALMSQFFRDMEARRKQRGLQGGGPRG